VSGHLLVLTEESSRGALVHVPILEEFESIFIIFQVRAKQRHGDIGSTSSVCRRGRFSTGCSSLNFNTGVYQCGTISM
jgi:hypothetical protein